MSTPEPPKPERRWYQFSLKTLLLVVTLTCVAFAWIGWWMQRAKDNRARVAAIERTLADFERLGGNVFWYREEGRPPTWLERQFDDPGGDDGPVDVSLLGSSFTDAELEHLKELPQLRRLNLTNTRITDAGLREHLKGLTNLQELWIGGTPVTDGGLEHLKELTNLQRLDLYYTGITDTGLEHLKGLTNLVTLMVYDTWVSDEGVEKLRQALPNCDISYYGERR